MRRHSHCLVHELATNAARYGALSNAAGRVAVSWSIEGQGEAARLRFGWQERDGPLVAQPARKGFGSKLLETALPLTNGSPPRLSFDSPGLIYEVDVAIAAISAI
jgi:two-component sensor histidine kinase